MSFITVSLESWNQWAKCNGCGFVYGKPTRMSNPLPPGWSWKGEKIYCPRCKLKFEERFNSRHSQGVDSTMDTTAIALEAITEGVNILYNLAAITHNKQWVADSIHTGNLDKLAQALGFPNALAVQERIEGDRQHEADKYRDLDWSW